MVRDALSVSASISMAARDNRLFPVKTSSQGSFTLVERLNVSCNAGVFSMILGVVLRAGLGQTLALPPARGPAPTFLAQAAAALGAGGVGAAVASCVDPEPSHPSNSHFELASGFRLPSAPSRAKVVIL